MEEDNLREIAELIFTQPPRKEKTIQLQLEDGYTTEIAQEMGVDRFVLNIVRLISLHGVEILYGHRNPTLLTEENYFVLKAYINSFGFDVEKSFDSSSGALIIKFMYL